MRKKRELSAREAEENSEKRGAEVTKRGFLRIMKRLGQIGAVMFLSWPVLSFLRWRPGSSREVIFQPEEHKEGVWIKNRVILIVEKGAPLALSARCTHLGCTVNYHASGEKFVCPCHGSVYDRRGKRLLGPAQQDLPALPLSRGEQDAWIVRLEAG